MKHVIIQVRILATDTTAKQSTDKMMKTEHVSTLTQLSLLNCIGFSHDTSVVAIYASLLAHYNCKIKMKLWLLNIAANTGTISHYRHLL